MKKFVSIFTLTTWFQKQIKRFLFSIFKLWNMCKNCDIVPHAKRRFIFVCILDIVNFMFILWGNISQPNISSYFLFVFIGNLMVYFGYYVTMKKLHKESIPWVGYIVALLALICVIPALWYLMNSFFFVKTKNFKKKL